MVTWQEFSKVHLNEGEWEEDIQDLLIQVGKGGGKKSPICTMGLA